MSQSSYGGEGMAAIQTYMDAWFDLADPKPTMVSPEDIARALACQCRYNGHCSRFYSVAEHSVIVSEIVPPELRIHGLLHDAHEAYTGDIVCPLKRLLPGLRQIERRVQAVIYEALGLRWPLSGERRVELKCADRRVLATEHEQLFAHWRVWDDDIGVKPLDRHLECLPPSEAEWRFMQALKACQTVSWT